MPSSTTSQITVILDLLQWLRPDSVLDVGVGFGRYGFLIRDMLDYGGGSDRALTTTERRVHIDGIEAHEAYLVMGQERFYDAITVGDARTVLPGLGEQQYNVALLLDVLEHFTHEEGEAVMRELHRVAQWTIVATPRQFFRQGAEYGNTHEVHRSVWTRRGLVDAGARLFLPDPGQHIALMCSDLLADEKRTFLRAYSVHIRLLYLKLLFPERVVNAAQRAARVFGRKVQPHRWSNGGRT